MALRAPRSAARSGAAVLAALCLATACTGSDDPAADPSPGKGDVQSASASPAASVRSTPPSPSAAAQRGPDVVRLTARFDPSVTFRTPTGNIACRLSAGAFTGVHCRAAEHSWTSQAEDAQATCPAKHWAGVQLREEGAVIERDDCYDIAADSATVLGYGTGWEIGGVRCVSEQRGVTCLRVADRTGFSISRDVLRLEPWEGPLVSAPARPSRGLVMPAGFRLAFRAGDSLSDCLAGPEGVSCLVRTRATAPPARDCDLEEVTTARLPVSGPGRLVKDCRSDANGARDLLDAGESVQVGDVRCTADSHRLRCERLSGRRHGFEVSEAGFRGF